MKVQGGWHLSKLGSILRCPLGFSRAEDAERDLQLDQASEQGERTMQLSGYP